MEIYTRHALQLNIDMHKYKAWKQLGQNLALRNNDVQTRDMKFSVFMIIIIEY